MYLLAFELPPKWQICTCFPESYYITCPWECHDQGCLYLRHLCKCAVWKGLMRVTTEYLKQYAVLCWFKIFLSLLSGSITSCVSRVDQQRAWPWVLSVSARRLGMHYHGKLSGAHQSTVTAGASKSLHTGHAKMEMESEKITERTERVQEGGNCVRLKY